MKSSTADNEPYFTGSHLRQVRRAHNLSQRELAELTGLSNPYLSQLETGNRVPTPRVLARLSGVFGKDWLQNLTQPPHVTSAHAVTDSLQYCPGNTEQVIVYLIAEVRQLKERVAALEQLNEEAP